MRVYRHLSKAQNAERSSLTVCEGVSSEEDEKGQVLRRSLTVCEGVSQINEGYGELGEFPHCM